MGRWRATPNWPRPPLSEAETQLSDAMLGYWTSFIRDGAPTAAGQTPWPRYTLERRAFLDIDERPAAQVGLHAAAFAWDDALIAERRRKGLGWRLDIGFLAFPSPLSTLGGGVDAPIPDRQRDAQ